MMTVTTTQMILYVLVTLIIIGMVFAFTGIYWRRAIRKVKVLAHESAERLTASHEVDVKERLEKQLQTVRLDRMKDRVTLEKQAQTMKSKLDFYFKVLSEIQSLHNGMTSYMELLNSPDLELGQEELNMMRQHMDERADYIREMVDSTLKIMIYEDMKEIERKDHVLVNSFCQDVFESCQHYMTGNVDLRVETHLDDDEKVLTNMKLLQQVLIGLLRSSLQFTHEGEIVLKVSHFREKDKKGLLFSVCDSGLGIPDTARDVAFEQMQDTDISIKIVVVRLRLCRALVRLLGGTISIDSHYTPGTRIYFNIKA